MLDGIQRAVPDAAIGHIGLYRDAETLRPVSYYEKVPVNVAAAEVLLLDPMLATGNSACEAASILKAQGARSVQFLCVVACPAGVEQFQRAHPDVPIVAAAIAREILLAGIPPEQAAERVVYDERLFRIPGFGTVVNMH